MKENRASTLNVRGKLLDLQSPLVMGILNITDDSFYAGSRVTPGMHLLDRARKMVEEGADILDVGAMSTRPGAVELDAEDEVKKVKEAISILRSAFHDIPISVDTYRGRVAYAAFEEGADILNDISGYSFDDDLITFIKDVVPAYILMHNKARSEVMNKHASYDNVVLEVFDYFKVKLAELREMGLTDVVLDPGFGFSKRIAHNFELLRNLEIFNQIDAPLLVGISRKSMIYKTLNTTPEYALNGTTALHMFALERGANILRVHDVGSAVETISLWQQLK